MGFLSSIFKAAGPIASLIPGVGPVAGALIGGVGTAAGQHFEQRDADQRTSQLQQRSDARYNETFEQSKAAAELGNAQRIAQAKTQMDFQERMSNTSHQREIADLSAAGLNPILSSKYGGSSTPGGAMAQIADTSTPAQTSAQGARAREAELANASAQVNQQRAATKNVNAQTSNTQAATAKTRAETANTKLMGTTITQNQKEQRAQLFNTLLTFHKMKSERKLTSAKRYLTEQDETKRKLETELMRTTTQEHYNAQKQAEAIFHLTGGGTVQGANAALKFLSVGKALFK
nr:MAG: DNA pilot protein [Microvirus sp.]